jgi:hypothetical protein
MNKAMTCALGAIALLTVSGCTEKTSQVAEYPAMILGNWECDFRMNEDGMKMNGTLEAVYRRDGTTTGTGEFKMEVEGNTYDFIVTMDATYLIEGAIIDETLTGVSLDEMKIEGPILQQIEEKVLISLMESEIEAAFADDDVISSRIDVLNQNTFKYTDLDEGTQESCKRVS